MSRKATEFQKTAMSRMYRGTEIFKPLNTGWIDENLACVREWVANIFFYRKQLLKDGETLRIGEIKVKCFLVPGHTWGHMVYLVDDKYLFTGDTLWFGADGGYSFISALAEDNQLAVKSLATLEAKLQKMGAQPLFITGHTGWTDNFEFAFAHKDKLCSPFRKRVHDPNAPYDAYDESDDTEQNAKSGYLAGVGR